MDRVKSFDNREPWSDDMTSSSELDLFPLTMEAGAAIQCLNDCDGAVVCTMPEPWALVADTVRKPMRLIEATSMELARLHDLSREVPDGASVVIGLGGGSSLDTAKFVAQSTQLPLIQIPSIISVDAAFTTTYGYRAGSRVRYAGDVRPIEVVADPVLIRRAPRRLNRAGVGDLLSCHTAMFDWGFAINAGIADIPWNAEAAAIGAGVLDGLEFAAQEISMVSDEGVRFLARSHRLVGAACSKFGARFEEGSEHFLAYCLEWRTHEHRVHGELVSFGVLAMSLIQGNNPDRAARIVRATGVDARPAHLAINEAVLMAVFEALPDYCARDGLWPTVIGSTDLTADLARTVLGEVRLATGHDAP